jgi:cysteinyl-tRNA synthetase
VKDYGKLSHQDLDQMRTGARVEVNPNKRDPLDFALWKAKKEGEPSWGSPWGEGRPGWHIECSVMSMKYLGETFDIHGGARDLIFPHHENEIVQAEGATGKQFVRYWFHTGFLNVEGEKMSKSLGNVISIRDIIAETDPLVLRLFYLQTHYRSPIDFSKKALEGARNNFERLREFLERLDQTKADKEKDEDLLKKAEETEKKFVKAMDDDFNTPEALAEVYTLIRFGNGYLDEHKRIGVKAKKAVIDTLQNLLGILGIKLTLVNTGIKDLIEKLIQKRQDLREQKDFASSDSIRAELHNIGVILKDGSDGTIWSLSEKSSKDLSGDLKKLSDKFIT